MCIKKFAFLSTCACVALANTARAEIPASAYIQDGLIAQWDGIDNADTGAHDPDATAWVELKGGLVTTATALTFKDGNCGYFNGTDTSGTLLSGDLPAALEAISNGAFTAEVRFTPLVYKQYAGLFHFGVSGSTRYFSLSADNNSFIGAFQYKRSVWDAANCLSLAVATINVPTNVSAIADGPNHTLYLGNSLVSTHSAGPYTAYQSTAFQFGRYATAHAARAKMNCYAIRLYNRVLSVDEIAWNAKIDNARFSYDSGGVRLVGEDIQYRISFPAQGDGTVAVDGGAPAASNVFWITEGTTTNVALTAAATGEAVFRWWRGDASAIVSGSATNAEIGVTASAPLTLTAEFGTAIGDYWTLDAAAKTLTHSANGMVLKAALLSGTNVTVTGVVTLNALSDVDLSLPVFDAARNPYAVVSVGASAFKSQATIAAFSLPETLKRVESSAFNGCTALATMTPLLPDAVEYVGDSAFYGATLLEGGMKLAGVLHFGNSVVNGSRIKSLDFRGSAVTNIGSLASSPPANVWPLLPPTCQNIPSMSGMSVTNDLFLSNPHMATLWFDHIRYSKWTSVDMTGSSIKKMAGWAMYGCSLITNVVFAKCFTTFPNVNATFGGCSVKSARFRGDPFVVLGVNPFGAHTGFSYYLPKWNKNWEAALADAGYCTVSEMTSAECEYFRAAHPGEPIPVQRLTVNSLSSNKGISWWYPDPPPLYETVAWRDVLGYDGAAATVPAGGETLFDGTTYSYNTTAAHLALRWLGADGAEAVYEVPAAATNTRALKLTGYRLHQCSSGDYANSRAPTAWTLYGKALGSDVWDEIDTVEMTAESANTWAYLTNTTYTTAAKAQTCPARAACSLAYPVPAPAQKCYQAFKFAPSNSYNKTNSVEDATPYALMELEFLGEMTTADPEIGSFGQSSATWESITFSAVVLGLGEQPALGRTAQAADAWVEVSAGADFETVLAASPKGAVTAGVEGFYEVSGLAGDTSYYARLVVSNDLDAVVVRELSGVASTLAEPWVPTKPVCSRDADGRLVVDFNLAGLYAASATVSFAYAASPAAEFSAIGALREVSAAGNLQVSAGFEPTDPQGTVKVTVTALGVTRTYLVSVYPYWIADSATAPTSISNGVHDVVFAVTASGTNLTLSAKIELRDATEFDFSYPVWSGDASQAFALASVGTVFKEDLAVSAVVLPDAMTAVPANAFLDCVKLARVHLPSNLVSIGGSAFKGCALLSEIDPLFPAGCTAIGGSAFQQCTLLPNFTLADGMTTIEGSTFQYCTTFTDVTIPDSVTAIRSFAFGNCWSLTNFQPRFLPPQVGQFGGIFEGTPIKGRLVIDHPSITTIVGDMFRYMRGLTEADLSASSIVSISGSTAFYSCSSLGKVTFPPCFTSFPATANARDFHGCPIREVVFLGAPPALVDSPFDSAYYIIRVPRGGTFAQEWQSYFAAHPDWLSYLTPAEQETFRTRYPEEAHPARQWLNLGGKTGMRYLKFFGDTGLVMVLR